MLLTVILSLIGGSLLVYISKYNFNLVDINLGFYQVSKVPLFYVMIGSLLVGLFFSYGLYLVHALSNSWTLRGKDGEIKKNKSEVLELTKRIHQLEIENEKMKGEMHPRTTEERNML